MWTAAILGILESVPKLLQLIDRAVSAYEANVKVQWAQSLQAELHPLQQGVPTTDEQKFAAAKAVADAIAKMPH